MLNAAVTDHSHGLKIAGGMSMAEAADQHGVSRDRFFHKPGCRLQACGAGADLKVPRQDISSRGSSDAGLDRGPDVEASVLSAGFAANVPSDV
jgi:hypothetical protein